jgi:hypothetical protein
MTKCRVWGLISLMTVFASPGLLMAQSTQRVVAAVARFTATPLYDSLQDAKDGTQDSSVMLRNEMSRQNLSGMKSAVPGVDEVRLKVLDELEKCHDATTEIKKLDAGFPDLEKLAKDSAQRVVDVERRRGTDGKLNTAEQVESTANGVFAIAAGVTWLLDKRQIGEERDKYKQSHKNARLAACDLIDTASKFCTSPLAKDPVLSVDINGSWNGHFVSDNVWYTNVSGKPLTDVVT